MNNHGNYQEASEAAGPTPSLKALEEDRRLFNLFLETAIDGHTGSLVCSQNELVDYV